MALARQRERSGGHSLFPRPVGSDTTSKRKSVARVNGNSYEIAVDPARSPTPYGVYGCLGTRGSGAEEAGARASTDVSQGCFDLMGFVESGHTTSSVYWTPVSATS